MNQGQTARLEGFRAQLETDGVWLVNLGKAGGKVFGLLAVNPPVEIPSDLIEDRREKALFEMTGPCVVLSRGDKLKDAQGHKWQAWSREDNPADTYVKFWLVKLVPGVDK